MRGLFVTALHPLAGVGMRLLVPWSLGLLVSSFGSRSRSLRALDMTSCGLSDTLADISNLLTMLIFQVAAEGLDYTSRKVYFVKWKMIRLCVCCGGSRCCKVGNVKEL